MPTESPSEMQKYNNTSEYLVFTSAGQKFGLRQEVLIAIIDMPRHTTIPHMPSHMRGVIDYMGKAVPVYDLRKKMGFPSLGEETNRLIESLELRKQDHLSWLEKLKSQVEQGQEISVQTDPHKCAFGIWYDSCKFHSYNLTDYMSQFDAPHKRIHSLAVEVDILIQSGKLAAAKDVIHSAENDELLTLITLFDGAAKKIRQFTYEYTVIFERANGQCISILADNLDYFGLLDEVISPLPMAFSQLHSNFIDALGRRSTGDETEEILILDIEKFLLDEAGNPPAMQDDANEYSPV